jgi:adenylate kinase family enzyme
VGDDLARVSVVGTSGAGKSVFGRALAARLRSPYVELDSLMHHAGWQANPSFVEDVAAAIASDRWVVDGNYRHRLGMTVWSRATTVAWLDYERPLVMRRVLRRSLSRALRRQELWNGNRERVRAWVRPDHPIRWTWTGLHARRAEMETQLASPLLAHLTVHRFGHPREAEAWLASIEPP